MPVRARVGVEPDVRAEAQIARGLAVDEGRIGEQRRDDRLQRQRDAQLLDHVGFVGEVEIGLHGARAVHHRGAERADLFHVGRHDAVARLRHAPGCRRRDQSGVTPRPRKWMLSGPPTARQSSRCESSSAAASWMVSLRRAATVRTGRRVRARCRRRRQVAQPDRVVACQRTDASRCAASMPSSSAWMPSSPS